MTFKCVFDTLYLSIYYVHVGYKTAWYSCFLYSKQYVDINKFHRDIYIFKLYIQFQKCQGSKKRMPLNGTPLETDHEDIQGRKPATLTTERMANALNAHPLFIHFHL